MERIKSYIPLLLLCMIPFGFLSFGIVHEGQQIAFIIAFVAIMASTINNVWITSFYWYLCLWMLFICIMRMISDVPQVVYTQAMEQFIFMAAGLSIYAVISKLKAVKTETFYNAICITALLQASIAFMQRFGFDPVVLLLNQFTNAKPLLPDDFMIGTLGNNNFLAAYLAVSMPFFFRKKWIYALVIIIPCIMLCDTTAAVIPAIIGTTYYYYPDAKAKDSHTMLPFGSFLLTLGMIIGLVYAFIYHPFISNPRWEMWADAFNQITFNSFYTLFGYGIGASWGQPFPMHNEWLQCWHMYGIIGLSLMVGYAVTIYRGNRLLFTAFLIAAINMFGNYSLHLAPSAFLICMITGLIEREKERNN